MGLLSHTRLLLQQRIHALIVPPPVPLVHLMLTSFPMQLLLVILGIQYVKTNQLPSQIPQMVAFPSTMANAVMRIILVGQSILRIR